ncbi:MAG: hypothetical protein FWE16_05570 [Firmicutes bacterium]|nr:hypothetical protein [Bacillota bacterium]
MEGTLSILFAGLGFALALAAFIFTLKNDRRVRVLDEHRIRADEAERRRQEILGRPQFKVISGESVKYNANDKVDYDIDAFFLPYESLDADMINFTPLYNKNGNPSSGFNPKGRNGGFKKPYCKYKDVFKNKNKDWVSWVVELENIGKSNVIWFYLLSNLERDGSLMQNCEQWYQTLSTTGGAEYVVPGRETMISTGDRIKLRVSFHKNHIVQNFWGCSFDLMMETEDGSRWRQILSHDNNRLIMSKKTTAEEMSKYYRGEFLDAVMYDRVYWDKYNFGGGNRYSMFPRRLREELVKMARNKKVNPD